MVVKEFLEKLIKLEGRCYRIENQRCFICILKTLCYNISKDCIEPTSILIIAKKFLNKIKKFEFLERYL